MIRCDTSTTDRLSIRAEWKILGERRLFPALDPFGGFGRTGADRQNVVAGFRDKHFQFPLGRQAAILRHDRPTVLEVHDVTATGVDHRFDRENHAGFENGRFTLQGEVADMRFAVKDLADAVTAVLLNDRKPHFLAIVVTGDADVVETVAGLDGFDPGPHAFERSVHEALAGDGGLADNKHARVVAEVAVFHDGDVDVDDVTVFKFLRFARNPVAYDVIDGDAGGRRIGRAAVRAIPQTGGSASQNVDRMIEHQSVEFGGRDAGFDIRRDEVEKFGRKTTDFTHVRDVFGRINRNVVSHGKSRKPSTPLSRCRRKIKRVRNSVS